MSEVKVDKISPKTGTSMTVGDSGDTFTVPSGATLTVAGALNVTGTTSLADGTVNVAEIDIDGATDIGEAIVDADLFVVDNGAGGTNRKTAASRLKTFILADNSLDSDMYVDASIDNAHLADNAVDTAEIADNAITLAKMAGGTDGNIISYDASGDPVAIATGSDGQVLTSAGSGQPPAFEALPAGFSVTSITGATAIDESLYWNDEFVLHDASAGGLKRIDATYMMNRPFFRARMTGDQGISSSSWTKVAFNGEATNGDPDSTYDTTNYRWTPGRNGWYQIFWTGSFGDVMDIGEFIEMQVYKNGSAVPESAAAGGQLWHKVMSHTANRTISMNASFTVYLDNNDYIEIYCQQNDASTQNLRSFSGHFGGYYLIGAISGQG